MAFNFKNVSIAVSLLIAGLMIGAAFILSSESALSPNAASAGTTDELLKSYAAKDTDSDLLPDWEEALYGTNPSNPHTIDPKLSDKEAVDKGLVKPKYSATPAPAPSLSNASVAPDTVTAAFAKELLKQYLLSRGPTPPTKEEVVQFVDSAVGVLEKNQVIADRYTSKNVVTVENSETAIRTYLVQAEKVVVQTSTGSKKSEPEYISDLITKKDATAGPHLAQVGKAYTSAAAAMIKLPVPIGASALHLKTVNTFVRMGNALTDISVFTEDPLRAMIGLHAYEKVTRALFDSFAETGTFLKVNAITFSKGEPGYLYFSGSMTAESAASHITP